MLGCQIKQISVIFSHLKRDTTSSGWKFVLYNVPGKGLIVFITLHYKCNLLLRMFYWQNYCQQNYYYFISNNAKIVIWVRFCKLIFFMLQEWVDYDEKVNESVGIYEIKHKFVKLKWIQIHLQISSKFFFTKSTWMMRSDKYKHYHKQLKVVYQPVYIIPY